MKRRLAILVFAAACGSSSPAPVDPATAGSAAPTAVAAQAAGVLGIAEITVKESGKDMMAVHANGDVQINDTSGWKTIGKLETNGKLTTADGKTGQLGPDGVFTTPEGPAPFKIDGAALVAGNTRITIENGKIVGGDDAAKSVDIVGANDDATKRTTLLLLGLLLTGQEASSGPASATAPAATAPTPATK